MTKNVLYIEMNRGILFLIILLFLSPNALKADVNPFLQFADKPYASYHYALRDSMRKRYGDDKAVALAFEQMRALPDTYHNHQWQMEADYRTIIYAHYHYKTLSAKDFESQLKVLLKESRRYHNKVFEFRIIRSLFDLSVENNVADQMDYAYQLEKMFARVTPEEYPDVIDARFRLGEIYFKYKDYIRAERSFKKVVDSPVLDPIQLIYIHARNDLGVIYRDYYHDYDQSDKWFLSIKTFDKQYPILDKRDRWMAIVEGNIGINCFYRKEYPEAVQKIQNALKLMYAVKDYPYTFEVAPIVSQSYSAMQQYDKAKEYLDLAALCRTHFPADSLSTEDFYLASSKYYSGKGNARLSGVYADSAFMEHNKWDNKYNMNNFLRIEQKASQKALQQEMNQKQAYRDRFMFFMLLSFVVLASLIVYIILYAKKRKAYRLLVLQNQQWARNPIDGNPKTAVNEANDKDMQLWNTIKNFVEEHEYYTNDEVSLDSLSKDLGINRTYVSNVINSHEDNFPTFINRYRIQKSINLLSEEHPDSLDNISASVGFKNRKTFYNAFKNLTGLSPSQFKNNLQKASSEEKS